MISPGCTMYNKYANKLGSKVVAFNIAQVRTHHIYNCTQLGKITRLDHEWALTDKMDPSPSLVSTSLQTFPLSTRAVLLQKYTSDWIWWPAAPQTGGLVPPGTVWKSFFCQKIYHNMGPARWGFLWTKPNLWNLYFCSTQTPLSIACCQPSNP